MSNFGVANEYQSLLNISPGNSFIASLTPNTVVYVDATNNLASLPAMTNGQVIIGNSGNPPSVNAISVTPNLIETLGAGTISLDTVQGIQTTSSPTFNALTLTTPLAIASGGNGTATPVITVSGGLVLTGSWNNYNIDASGFVETITAGLNIAITGTAQNPIVNTIQNPVFQSETLSNTTNQILFGTSGAHTLQLDVHTTNMTANNTLHIFDGFTSGSMWFSDNLPTNIANETNGACTGFGRAIGGTMTGTNNTLYGYFSGSSMTVDTNVCAFGDNTYVNAQGGRDNTALGHSVMAFLSNGQFSTGVGSLCMAGGTITGSQNDGYGYQSLYNLSSGLANVCYGFQSGMNISTQSNNTMIGNAAGKSSTGHDNVFIGQFCGNKPLSTGASFNNVGIGSNCMSGNITTANQNVCIGLNAGEALVSGHDCVLLGFNAGSANNSTNSSCICIGSGANCNAAGDTNEIVIGSIFGAGSNTITIGGGSGVQILAPAPAAGRIYSIGDLGVNGNFVLAGTTEQNLYTQSGSRLLSSAGNTAYGQLALSNYIQSSSTTDRNTAYGNLALESAIVGSAQNNNAFGNNCLGSLTSGKRNCAYGSSAGAGLTSGVNNAIYGHLACSNADIITNCVCIGQAAGDNMAAGVAHTGNIFCGFGAGGLNVNSITGLSQSNICIGIAVGGNLSTVGANTPTQNTLIGGAGNLTSGSSNCAYGTASLPNATICNNMTMIGVNSGIAFSAAQAHSFCIGIGVQALGNANSTTTGALTALIGIGADALGSITSCSQSIAVGHNCLVSGTSLSNCTAVGYLAGQLTTTSADCTYIGNQCCTLATTANQCIGLGSLCQLNANNDSNEIVIGYNTTGFGSNTATIGNTSLTDISTRGTTCTLGSNQIFSKGFFNTVRLATGAVAGKFWKCTNGSGDGQWDTVGSDHAGPIYGTPGNSSSTTIGSPGTMSGFGTTFNFTPITTGNVQFLFMCTGNNNSVTNQDNTIRLVYGTGTIPAGGAAGTGTAMSTTLTTHNGSSIQFPLTCIGYVAGLTLGTRYWFDVQLWVNAASTFQITQTSGILNELL